MKNYEFLQYENNDGIAWVRINRPEVRNALNKATLLELIDVFSAINGDESVNVVLFTGNGKCFVGGADMKEIVDMPPFEYMEYGDLYARLNKLIRENSKPVIGVVNGHAMGGGNILIMSADIIVASERAKFCCPEIHLGIFGGAALLPSVVGRYRAAELVLLGEAYTAEQAREMGIVNKVVAPEELEQTALEYATKINAKSPSAVRMAKKALIAGALYDINTSADMQLPLLAMLYAGHDQKEGMNAFFEKRDPQWTGK